MNPAYETVVDPTSFVFTMGAYLLHGAFAGLQVGLALYLLATGARTALRDPADRVAGAGRALAGLALLLPVVTGAPLPVSLAAAVAAAALVWRQPSGWLRTAAIPATALLVLFMLWEREDPVALGLDLVTTMQEVRAEEVSWQLAADREAPKVGEMAPDFTLEDPNGETAVRLSEFRGKRPVALMFGSYT